MNTKLLSLKSLSLAVLLCVSAAAHADITIFTDRTAFLAAIQTPGGDTFNDLSVAPTATPLARIAGPYSYLASAGPAAAFFPAGTPADIWLATDLAADGITFSNFSGGVRGFGGNFFGSDLTGAFSPNRTMVLTATDGSTTRTVNLYNSTLDSFLGFISADPLTSVTLRPDGLPGNAYWVTANDVTMGVVAQVPEPETYGMLLAGLGLLGAVARRRAA